MNGLFALVRDKFGVWAIDRAGVEEGWYRASDIEAMVQSGELGPHTWLRHVFSRRYSLAGEVLYYNGRATKEQFDSWFPEPRGLRNNLVAR